LPRLLLQDDGELDEKVVLSGSATTLTTGKSNS
jgi:hypothetical protein